MQEEKKQAEKFSIRIPLTHEPRSSNVKWNILLHHIEKIMMEFVAPELVRIIQEYISGAEICAVDITQWAQSRQLSCKVVDVKTLPAFPVSRFHSGEIQDEKTLAANQADVIAVDSEKQLTVIDDGKCLYSYQGEFRTTNDQSHLVTRVPYTLHPTARVLTTIPGSNNWMLILDMKNKQLKPLRLKHFYQLNSICVNSDNTWCFVGAGDKHYFLCSLVTGQETSICMPEAKNQAVVERVAFHPKDPTLLAVAFKEYLQSSISFAIVLYRVSTAEDGKGHLEPLCSTRQVGLFDAKRTRQFRVTPATELVWSKSGRFISYCVIYRVLECKGGFCTEKTFVSIESFDINLENRHQEYFTNPALVEIVTNCLDSPACELPGLFLLDSSLSCTTHYFATSYCMASYDVSSSELQLFVADTVLARFQVKLPNQFDPGRQFFLKFDFVQWSANREKLYVIFVRYEGTDFCERYLCVIE